MFPSTEKLKKFYGSNRSMNRLNVVSIRLEMALGEHGKAVQGEFSLTSTEL